MCVFQCQPTALLRASGSTQGVKKAISEVYFRITHRFGRPHYVWTEYLYIVREKVVVGMIVSLTVCIGPSVIVLCGMMMKGREKVKPAPVHSLLFSKSTKGPPCLTSPSDGRFAINSNICLLNIHTAEGFEI